MLVHTGPPRFALIGSGASGKSSIAKAVAAVKKVTLLDIDHMFVAEFGPIRVFGQQHGWRKFFETQAELARSALSQKQAGPYPLLIVMPASSLCHQEYLEVSSKTLDVAKANAFLICILADRNHQAGANMSVKRQNKRDYPFSTERKFNQYIYQSTFYERIADSVIINDGTVDEAATRVCLIMDSRYP